VGVKEGELEGALVGAKEGALLGEDVGDFVGPTVGTTVGCTVAKQGSPTVQLYVKPISSVVHHSFLTEQAEQSVWMQAHIVSEHDQPMLALSGVH
jgi:hypothetical protein